MAQPTTAEIVSLYRSFIRVQHSWPRQDARPASLRKHLLERVRIEFREPVVEGEGLRVRYAHGEQELRSLRRLLKGEIDKEFPLSPSSTMLDFLPAKKMYTLLDQAAQQELADKSSVSYFKDYVASKFER
ncbi:uncharacterized protein EV422DRAFT_499823 [Fimicolochytrium jonesii]|uniref:uncharacterized protein n=1 Tax=Fimicolochytrium jonesii TaxID=1396493 RepID=UPI0022FE9155|nr:uncharacterized protein EV422DRAFT_499823 [Fimicolochytrium jonesii]KAI8817697.1 hypothetical protein EV422DRAFT_499823 [Fimicolochytrium jonesii]